MSAEPAVNTNAENPAGTDREARGSARWPDSSAMKLICLTQRRNAARTASWLLADVCRTASSSVAAAARWKRPIRTAAPSVSPR